VLEIPAQSKRLVSFLLTVRTPGPFAEELVLYVEDGGFNKRAVSIRGEAKAASVGD
jgi:hypothetical protein